MSNEDRIKNLENKVEKHDEEIKKITEVLPEIVRKLDQLLLSKEFEKKEYKLHKSNCEEYFDEKYVHKAGFRSAVIEILRHIKEQDLDYKQTTLGIVHKVINIIFKVSVPIGIFFIIGSQYLF